MTCKINLFALLCLLFVNFQTIRAEGEPLFDLDVSIRAGDPDGDITKGTLRVLAHPKIVTQNKRAVEYWFPGRREDIGPGKPCMRVRLTVESLKGDSIRLLVEQEEVTAAKPMMRVESKEVKTGDKVRLEQIPFGVGQIWVEAVVRVRK